MSVTNCIRFNRFSVFVPLLLLTVAFDHEVAGFKSIIANRFARQKSIQGRQLWKQQEHHTNIQQRPGHVRNPLGTRLTSSTAAESPTKMPENSKLERRLLLVWVHVISGFVVYNYTRQTIWPGFLLQIPVKVWHLIHGLSAMVFAGGIVTTTLLEWKLPSIAANMKDEDGNADKSSIFLLTWLWQVESRLVLPAVTGSLVSGVAQAFYSYPSFRMAPSHVKSALHLMFLFGVWWAWTDRRSQASLRKGGFDESKVVQRRLSNLVSCAFLVGLYAVMILKPGYNFPV